MKIFRSLAALPLLAALIAPALADDSMSMPMKAPEAPAAAAATPAAATTTVPAILSDLPKACVDAMKPNVIKRLLKQESNVNRKIDHKVHRLTEHDQAARDSMQKMIKVMMAAHSIRDPDLAFNCGMIAHHQGAIDMAEMELSMGKDEATKTLAKTIIDAQKAEIKQMSDWASAHASAK